MSLKRIIYEIDLKDRLRWATHNLLAHPMMAVLPRTWGDWIHNRTTPRP